MNEPDGTPRRPWYREGWLWFVLAPPLSSVVLGLALVWTAFRYGDAEVVDDRVDVGRATQQLHEREQRAAEVGAAAELRIDGEGVRVVWEGDDDARPETLSLLLTHPTRASADLEWTLHPAGDDRFRLRAEEPVPDEGYGRRYVQLEPDHGRWRLVGELDADDRTLRLRPRPPLFARTGEE